jgi:hypothetical protein
VNDVVPPHYRVFRLVLVTALLLGLAAASWWVLRPAVLSGILQFLRVG